MALQIQERIVQTFAQPNIADIYGTYPSALVADIAVAAAGVKCAGLTVGIKDATTGVVTEYWYQPDGQGGLQLVEKQVAGGTEVEANPTGEATTPLNKIKIGETNYNIPQTDTSTLATKQELQQGLSGKQDTISDLQQIRTRADEGHTALQPIQDATPNNFVIFDANGNLQDSLCNEGTFIKGVQQNGTSIQPVDGVVDVTVQDGASAYDLYVDSLPAGTTPLSPEAWLASLKANIGAFKFVSYDQSAESDFTTGGIGTTYSSAIDNLVAGTDTTPDVILLMNNTDGTTAPTKTFMIATQEAATAGTYEFIYAGDLQSAMPSNVLTEDDIDSDFAGGSNKIASADEAKALHDKLYGEMQYQDVELNLQNALCYKTDGTYEHINVTTSSGSNYKCVRITCNPGDIFKIFGLGGGNTIFLYTFSDDTEVSSQYAVKSHSSQNEDTRTNGLEITAPDGAKLLSINFKEYNSETDGLQKLTKGNGIVDEIIFKNSNLKPSNVSVIDNLESNSATDILSAKQGKVLNTKIAEQKEDIELIKNGVENKINQTGYLQGSCGNAGTFTASESQACAIIPIPETWRGHRISSTAGIRQYGYCSAVDENNNVTWCNEYGRVTLSSPYQITNSEPAVPNDCNYLYVFYTGVNSSTITVEGIEQQKGLKQLSDEISNIEEQISNIGAENFVMFEKTADKCMVYVKTDDGDKYIGYPLIHRLSAYDTSVTNSFKDNWGIGGTTTDRVGIYSFDGTTMTFINFLYNNGESELAINVTKADGDGTNYVGGGAHGFEKIVTSNNARLIKMLVDGTEIAEDSIVPLKTIREFYVIQNSYLYQWTNAETEPSSDSYFAVATKQWRFNKDGLSITSEVKITKQEENGVAIYVDQCQQGMMCVFRRLDDNQTLPYITNRAVKNNLPYHTYNLSDGWSDRPEDYAINSWDINCTKITQYAETGYCFSIEMFGIEVPNNAGYSGMKVSGGNAGYNKAYCQTVYNYNAHTNDVFKATQIWKINKQRIASFE